MIQINKQRALLWTHIFLACGLLRGVLFVHHLNTPMQLENEYMLEVDSGATLNRIVNTLSADGILNNSFDFRLYARLSGKADGIKAGNYSLTFEMTPLDLIEKLTDGDVIVYQIVFVEGWTLKQSLQALQAHEMVVSTLDPDSQSELQENFQSEFYPEGLIFPDTYNFSKGTTDRELLLRAQQTMENILAEEWLARDVGLPYATPYEALIMASIIEKETALGSERQQIAGVFIRRLQLGMRLQTDPTVIYGLGDSFDGDLTRSDLQSKTPYNTYLKSGLPPTPIGLSGRDAIEASLHPDQGDTLFFVARGDGSHYFSSTLEEHQQAVQQYQLGNRQ